MALSDYELCARVEGKTVAHELYTELSDFTGSFFVELKGPDEATLYLPLSPNLETYYASALTFRDKDTGQSYTAQTIYTPNSNGQEIAHNAFLYNYSGSVDGKYHYLGSVPFVVKDANQPLKVTLRLTGYTDTGGGWADQVYTKIGIHIDSDPQMILEYASYGKSGQINYANAVIGSERIAYTLAAGSHSIGLCVWGRCTSKDYNRCYIQKVMIELESDGV